MQKAFIFDLDGTLADTMPVHFQVWQVVARATGSPSPRTRFYKLGGVPTAKIAALLIAEAGLDLDPLVVATEKEQAYVDGLVDGATVRPIEPVVEIARPRRAEGPLAIASGSLRHLVDRTLAALGITDWFGAVVAAEDTTRHKPEPDVFLEAARRLGVAPAAAPSTRTPISASRPRAAPACTASTSARSTSRARADAPAGRALLAL